MGQALTPALQVSERTVVTKVRELPLPGDILVTADEHVSAATKVAEAQLPGDLVILRIPEKLGIEPFEVLRGLKVKEGDRVEAGDLLCEHSGLFGLFRSRFHSPMAGVVELITERTGHLAIRLAPKLLELTAYLAGRVAAVEQRKSVTIEAVAAFVQGIFGIGGERQGTVRLLPVTPGAVVDADCIPESCQGDILIGGTCPSVDALHKAASGGASGIVVGAIDDRALSAFLGYDLGIALTGDENIPLTVIMTEGFGSIPMSDRAIALFAQHAGRHASINGATQVRAGALRPEVIVPLGQDQPSLLPPQSPPPGLALGAIIRLIRVPYFGLLGTVVELPKDPQRIETGAVTRVLKASLSDGRVVTVPRANVELVEGE